jgi:Protein of unknown function (DUF2939)
MRTSGFAATALVAGLVVITACSEGPESSVKSLGKAFLEQDRLKVTRYMDVDRTATSITTSLMTEVARQPARDSAGPGSELGEMFGTAMMAAMQPALTAYVREMIYYIADSSARMPSFGETASGAQPSRSSIRDSVANRNFGVRKARIEGDVALVPVSIAATPGQADSGTVDLRLERAGRNWRVVAVEHLPAAAFSSVAPKMP